jgi:glycosyltransferase involved in cell wall biosynthesis
MPAQVSIAMPVYNEAAVIAEVVNELKREIGSRLDVEIVMCNDASTDDTAAILDRLAADDPRVKVFHAERNGGHGPALRRALDETGGEWVFQIDSDGQQVVSEFWDLWAHRSHADLVMGIRKIRRNGRLRVVVSGALRYLNRLMGGGDLRDVNVPFKLFRRALWEDVSRAVPARPVAPSLLTAVGASVRGWRVEQVSITHLERPHGPSTVNLRKLIELTWGATAELVRFRRRLAGLTPRAAPEATRSQPESESVTSAR